MAKRTLEGVTTLSIGVPDDLDKFLSGISEPRHAAWAPEAGEHLFVTERLVVSPGAGVFRPEPGVGSGTTVEPGTLVGHVGSLEVRSAFAGRLVEVIAVDGERLAPSSPSPGSGASRDAGSVITGWGTALPDKVVTNDDLEAALDTTDEWIVERTGHPRASRRRHHRRPRHRGRPRGHGAVPAGGRPTSTLVVATSTPDESRAGQRLDRPARASACPGGAFDLNAACSGFVYGLSPPTASSSRARGCVLVVGADAMSPHRRLGRPRHRDPLRRRRRRGRAGARRRAPAACSGATSAPTVRAATSCTPTCGGTIEMDGPEVFRRAVRVMVDSADRALDAAGLTPADIDLFVPHQANQRITRRRLRHARHRRRPHRVDPRRHTGNTSAASIPWPWRRRPTTGGSTDDRGAARRASVPGMTVACAVLVLSGRRSERPGSHASRSSRAAAGASGSACAKAFAASGHRVAVTYRSEPPVDARPAGGAVRRHRSRRGRGRVHPGRGASSAPSRCWWPTPASTRDGLVAADVGRRLHAA